MIDSTAKEIERIRARCNAARTGRWLSWFEGRDHTSGSSFIQIGEGKDRDEDLYLSGDDRPISVEDHDFIANARQDIPFLLAEIDRLNNLLNSKKLNDLA
jgi:hypothetical protein